MTPEERAKASVDLTLTYLHSYYPDWRLIKVLSIKKTLNDKYEFFKDFIDDIKHDSDETGEATIAQEIRNGLYFDAISHCVQYVEDLFALINAADKPDFFVKSIITYKAGQVTNRIKGFKANRKEVAKAFQFPDGIVFDTQKDQKSLDDAFQYLIDLVKDIVKFYKDYEYFHNQYKHGLTVAMRPFGNIYTQEQIEQEKAGKFPFYLATYDNLSIEKASKKGTFNLEQGVFMAGFSENVRPFIGDLAKEDNYIRLVFPKDIDLSIDMLVNVARKTRECLYTFIFNYSHKINPEGKAVDFRLPIDYQQKKYFRCTYYPDEG